MGGWDPNQQIQAQAGQRMSGGGACPPAGDSPPIESGSVVRDHLGMHDQILSELHETISRLEARLEAALTPVPPQPATSSTSCAPTGPPASIVANRLANLRDGHIQAIQRLRELTQRVEV